VTRQVHNGGPTEDVLFDFVAGRLHPQASEWIESHLAACVRCGVAIDRVRALRQALEPPAETPFARQAAINAVKRRLEQPTRVRRFWFPVTAATLAAAMALVVAWRLRSPSLPSSSQPSLAALAPRGEPVPFLLTARQGAADLEVGDEHAVAQSQMTVPPAGALSVKPESRLVAQWGAARVVVDGGARGARVRLESSGSENRTLRLDAGRVVLDVDPLKKGATLAVLTEDAQVTVHGTRFLVERSAGGTLVAVEHGRVRVASAGRVVEVDSGMRLAPSAAGATPLEPDDVRAFTQWSSSLSAPAAPLSETIDIFADVPGAEVSLDSVAEGRAPLSLAVTPGVHRIRVTAPGRLPVEERVQVTAGQPTVFNAELPELRAALSIDPQVVRRSDRSDRIAEARVAEPRLIRDAQPGLPRPKADGKPVDVLDEARADLLAGNYRRSEERLELLLKRPLEATEIARAQLLEAQAFRLDRRPERAVPLLEKVSRGGGPEAEQGLVLLAQMLGRDLGDPRRASSVWAESQRRFPGGIFKEEAAYRSGESLLSAGETLEGLQAVERYLTAWPRGAHADDAHLLAANARRDRLGDCAGALPHLRAVASGRGPRAEMALVAEARCLKTVGRLDEARAAYSAYLASEPHGRFADEARAGVAAGAQKPR
jgi:ferric-dicitrate binding protein FerR (iron transport regulator)